MSEYPEHDKLDAVVVETQAVGEFLEWAKGKGVLLAQRIPGPDGEDWLVPQFRLLALLAEWKGIDRERLEQEKQAMLTKIREENEFARTLDPEGWGA